MPDVMKAKSDLASYIMAGWSVTWAVGKVCGDYRLWNYTGRGNAWIDDIVALKNSRIAKQSYM